MINIANKAGLPWRVLARLWQISTAPSSLTPRADNLAEAATVRKVAVWCGLAERREIWVSSLGPSVSDGAVEFRVSELQVTDPIKFCSLEEAG